MVSKYNQRIQESHPVRDSSSTAVDKADIPRNCNSTCSLTTPASNQSASTPRRSSFSASKMFSFTTSWSLSLTQRVGIYNQADSDDDRTIDIINMAQVQQHVELDRLRTISQGDASDREMHDQELVEEIEQPSLPPTDRGREAWLVLAGCSLIQIPVWGR